MNLSSVAATAPAPVANPALTRGPIHSDAKPVPGVDVVGGAQGGITTETLPNGVRLIIAERPGAKSTKVQVGIGAGSLQDPAGRLGMAHLLEHLAFEGSPKHSSTEQEAIRGRLGNMWNAYTDRDSVVYYGILPAKSAVTGAALLTDMFQHPATTGKRFQQELAAVKNEMVYWGGSVGEESWNIAERMVFGDSSATNNVIGTRKTVDSVTSKDLQDYHKQYFVGRNTVALVEGDSKSLALDTLRRELGKLPAGARVDNTDQQSAPVVKGQALQIVNDPSSDTVSIDVIIPVSADVLKTLKTPGKLVTASLNDMLFNRLRREGRMTYGASAELRQESPGTYSIAISTNVAKRFAKEAMAELMTTLTDAQDGFGPKTLDFHKQQVLSRLKAAEQAAPPSISDRAEEAFQGALTDQGISVPSETAADTSAKQRKAINAVTPASFAADMAQLINLDDMKILAMGALADGGSDLRAGLRAGGIDTKSLTMNPVDLSMYQDMGLKVTKETVPPIS